MILGNRFLGSVALVALMGAGAVQAGGMTEPVADVEIVVGDADAGAVTVDETVYDDVGEPVEGSTVDETDVQIMEMSGGEMPTAAGGGRGVAAEGGAGVEVQRDTQSAASGGVSDGRSDSCRLIVTTKLGLACQ